MSYRLCNVALCINVLKTLYFCGRRNGHCFYDIRNVYEIITHNEDVSPCCIYNSLTISEAIHYCRIGLLFASINVDILVRMFITVIYKSHAHA